MKVVLTYALVRSHQPFPDTVNTFHPLKLQAGLSLEFPKLPR